MKERFVLIMVLIALIDQITKLIIRINFPVNSSLPVIENFFSITYVRNTGASFGILQNMNFPLMIVGILVFIWLLRSYWKDPKDTVATALICAGIIGNVVDRILLGYVVDFVHFHFWPVFNVADSSICIGVVLLIMQSIKK